MKKIIFNSRLQSLDSLRGRFLFALAISSLCVFPYAKQSSSQDSVAPSSATPSWDVVLNALQAKRDAVNSLSVEYLMEYSLSPETKLKYEDISQAAFDRAKSRGNVPVGATKPEETYDRMATCRYQRRDILWREECSEIYPASIDGRFLNHFAGFDGEKHYAYDADKMHGLITATSLEALSAKVRYANISDGARYVGIWEPVNSLEETEELGVSFSPSGIEQVNGEQCIRYDLSVQAQSGAYTRNTLWVSPAKGYSVVKWKSELFKENTENSHWMGTVTVRNVLGFEKIDEGIFVNKLYQEDRFDSQENGELQWKDSRRFTLGSIRLNEDIPKSVFAIQFPPGTRVQDTILNPDGLTISGANSDLLSKGRRITPRELGDVTAPRPRQGESFLRFPVTR